MALDAKYWAPEFELLEKAIELAGRITEPGFRFRSPTAVSRQRMRGAPARAIQELAGHQDLSTTQRYMHLSPAAIESAIRLLDGPRSDQVGGEIAEAADRGSLSTGKRRS